jgi:DNA-directed RNA polymerase specialized sigma24 family protein
MPESHEASVDITLMRRELERLRDDVQQVGRKVEEVDAKVERARLTELAALAIRLAEETGEDEALIMVDVGMDRQDVAAALRISPNNLRVRLHRARRARAAAKRKAA